MCVCVYVLKMADKSVDSTIKPIDKQLSTDKKDDAVVLTSAQTMELTTMLKRFEAENHSRLSVKVRRFGSDKPLEILDFKERGPVRVIMHSQADSELNGQYGKFGDVREAIERLKTYTDKSTCPDCADHPLLDISGPVTGGSGFCKSCKTLHFSAWGFVYVHANGLITRISPFANIPKGNGPSILWERPKTIEPDIIGFVDFI